MSASDKVQCEIRLCYLISVFFGKLYYFFITVIMNVGMHTRPKSILCIFIQLKCWTQH